MRSPSTVRVGAEVAPALPMQPWRLREANRFPGTHSWEAREHFIPDCALTRHGAPRLPGRVTAGAGAGPRAGPRASPVVGPQPRSRVTAAPRNEPQLSAVFVSPWPSRQRACLSGFKLWCMSHQHAAGRPGRVFIPFRDFSAHPSPPSALRASLSYSLPAPGRKAEWRGGR